MPRVKKVVKRSREKIRRRLTRIRLLKAIPDSGGVLKVLAERLGCTYHAVWTTIHNKKYPDVNERLQEEIESVGDLAQQTIRDVMQQRFDLPTAARSARWWLEKKCSDRGFQSKSELTLEGGKKPLQVQQAPDVSIEDLDLPLDVRKALLKAIEQRKLLEAGG